MATKPQAKPAQKNNKTAGRLAKEINKIMGDGTITIGDVLIKTDVIKTDIAALDSALGIGGLPRGRMKDDHYPTNHS